MTKVKVLSLLLMVILAAVMLGACASPASETTPSSDTTVTPADTDALATTGDSDISLAPADKVEVVTFTGRSAALAVYMPRKPLSTC